MQRACAILPPVARPTLQYFSTLSHKGHDFRKKKLLNLKQRSEHNKYVLIFPAAFFWNVSHSNKNSVRHDHTRNKIRLYKPLIKPIGPGAGYLQFSTPFM